MKKAYRKPEAKVVDFSYDTQVTATSSGDIIPPGVEIRPDNPTYCQYFAEWITCKWVVSPSNGCDKNVPGMASL